MSKEQLSSPRILQGIKRRLSRMRHFRGHGIHSPYIYRLVREVFMTRHLIPAEESSIYDALANESRLRMRYRVELQNIYDVCGYSSSVIDSDLSELLTRVDMAVYTTHSPIEDALKGIDTARKCGTTVVIIKPKRDIRRERLCEEVVERHLGTTVWRADYLLIFNNHLPKQHFQL